VPLKAKAALGKAVTEKVTAEEKRKAKLTALKDLFDIQEEEVEWH